MLLGYNQPRPKEENYSDFMNKLVAGLKGLTIDGISLMIYGSYSRGEMDIGRSDIDGVMIFEEDVVIDKNHLTLCSKVLAEALRGNHVPFQVTVSDLRTMQDGRFNCYNVSFKDYFSEEGIVLVGSDYRVQFVYEMPSHPEQMTLAFNLRKSRQGLLFAEYDRENDYEQFLRKFGKSLDAVSRGSKQVLHMVDGVLTKNRFSALQRIPQEFPDFDTEPLARIKHLYQHPDRLDELYRKPDEVIVVWSSAVTFLEGLIREYLNRFPNEK